MVSLLLLLLLLLLLSLITSLLFTSVLLSSRSDKLGKGGGLEKRSVRGESNLVSCFYLQSAFN